MVDTQLLAATSNSGKIREISQILEGIEPTLVYLSDIPTIPAEPEETGTTFAENAQLKARYYAQLSQMPTIADDSGLSVLELDGFPGVQSARWTAGEDTARVQALLGLLEKEGLTQPVQRRAFFSCVVSYVRPDQESTIEFEGICWGTLAHVPLGQTGFGYDPIFIPDGESMTMAQLGSLVKNKISARAGALAKFKLWLQQHDTMNQPRK